MDGFSGNIFDGRQGSVEQRRFAIVVSRYNELLTDKLLDGALKTLKEHRVPDDQVNVYHVPGAWEIPLVASVVLEKFDAVICLGVVIRGETTHDVHINTTVSSMLGRLAVESGRPVSFGLLTCNSRNQAIQRSGGNVGNKGCEAANAAVETLQLLDAAK